jgi:acyl-CoA thioester hydrolase
MTVMWRLGKFDEAAWRFFNALGLTPSHLRAAKRGMAAVDRHISYMRELRPGDVVSVRTTLIGFKEKACSSSTRRARTKKARSSPERR